MVDNDHPSFNDRCPAYDETDDEFHGEAAVLYR
jgi:hypothetical protein